MIKCDKYITYEMERYPTHCRECPAFIQTPYLCHSERGLEADCELGYMAGADMRDFGGSTRYSKCQIENDTRVVIKCGF